MGAQGRGRLSGFGGGASVSLMRTGAASSFFNPTIPRLIILKP